MMKIFVCIDPCVYLLSAIDYSGLQYKQYSTDIYGMMESADLI